eukprot:jgi/Psemu1/58491/gm1.58491_g
MVPLHQPALPKGTAESPRVTGPPQNKTKTNQNDLNESGPPQNANEQNTEYPIHTGAGAYQIQAIPKLIQFYHAAAGYPTKETWALITLNLLHASRTQPKLSAYELRRGIYDYNKHPLAPMGCWVTIHDRAQERGAWQDHGTRGYYIGPALKHYRNYTCVGEASRATRTSNTVAFFPRTEMPRTSSTDRLLMTLQNLKEIASKPHPPIPYMEQGTQLNEALRSAKLRDTTNNAPEPLTVANGPNTKSNAREPPRVAPTQQRSARRGHPWAVGTIIRKKFNSGWYEGEVISYDQTNQYYKVRFTDGDVADYTHGEVSRYYKSDQYYSRSKLKPKALMG